MNDISRYDAPLFDLDGVITRTATSTRPRGRTSLTTFCPPEPASGMSHSFPLDTASDYLHHVDGRRRYDGVDTFPALPRYRAALTATPPTPPAAETICGLGNRKNDYFNQRLAQLGVEVFGRHSGAHQRRTPSCGGRWRSCPPAKTARAILGRAGLLGLFDTRVTGVEAAELHLSR